jgi:hypothetical protein
MQPNLNQLTSLLHAAPALRLQVLLTADDMRGCRESAERALRLERSPDFADLLLGQSYNDLRALLALPAVWYRVCDAKQEFA